MDKKNGHGPNKKGKSIKKMIILKLKKRKQTTKRGNQSTK